jgi:hypothetical protein
VLNTGYVHGLIHIGLAFEFKQPLLLAEGLAQAAVHHDSWYNAYLCAAEKLAAEAKEPPLPLADLFDMERADPKISTASSLDYHLQTRKYSGKWAMDKEFARDGIMVNAKDEILRLAARWRVSPDDDLEKKTAELVNGARKLHRDSQSAQTRDELTTSQIYSVYYSRSTETSLRVYVRFLDPPHPDRKHQPCFLPQGRLVHAGSESAPS